MRATPATRPARRRPAGTSAICPALSAESDTGVDRCLWQRACASRPRCDDRELRVVHASKSVEAVQPSSARPVDSTTAAATCHTSRPRTTEAAPDRLHRSTSRRRTTALGRHPRDPARAIPRSARCRSASRCSRAGSSSWSRRTSPSCFAASFVRLADEHRAVDTLDQWAATLARRKSSTVSPSSTLGRRQDREAATADTAGRRALGRRAPSHTAVNDGRRTGPSPVVDGADRHVAVDGGDDAEQEGEVHVLLQRGRQLGGTAQTGDVPQAGLRRDRLEVPVAGEHQRRRLRTPAGEPREPVGGVADQPEIVGDRRRADAELRRRPPPRRSSRACGGRTGRLAGP